MLDKLIHPRWPYLTVGRDDLKENEKDIERALGSLPDDPMNYDFYYHILEADEKGRQPKTTLGGKAQRPRNNPNFNQKSTSCLRRIADSKNKVGV